MEWLQELAAVIRIDQVALAGLVTLAVWMVLTGRLVPRSVLDDYKTALRESEKARGVLMTQNGELLELSRTTVQILRSIPGGDSRVDEATQPVRGDAKP